MPDSPVLRIILFTVGSIMVWVAVSCSFTNAAHKRKILNYIH